jgi:hypothetical protein
MRLRTKNEKILFGVMLVIVFGMVNFYGYNWLAKKQAALELTAAELRADQAEARVDLKDLDESTKRQAWIKQHQPALGEADTAKAQVLDEVSKRARDNKLEILEQGLVEDVTQDAGGAQIGVTLKVKGSMENLVRWLTALQKPDQFYAVSKFSLKADEDQKSMVCTLQLARYYFKEGS